MVSDTANDDRILKELDDKAKWRVARAYRLRRQGGDSDGPARTAAIDVLQELFPDQTRGDLSVIAGSIIAHAAKYHSPWFWDGTDHGWPPPWMPKATWKG